MGKARVLGKQTKVYVQVPGGDKVQVGEIDKFSATAKDETKISSPLGDAYPTSQNVNGGYDLSLDGGKVDQALARLMHVQDRQVLAGRRSPYFEIEHTIKHFDGTSETYVYEDVTLSNYGIDAGSNTDEITEKVTGFAAKRRLVGSNVSTEVEVVTAALAAMLDETLGAALDVEVADLATDATTNNVLFS